MKKWKPATRKRELDRMWSEYIRRRDKHCTFCGRTEGKLDANHIFSRRHTATRWNTDNGNTLCFTCHRRFHDDPLWGSGMAMKIVESKTWDAIDTAHKKIKKFDQVLYEVTKLELKHKLEELE